MWQLYDALIEGIPRECTVDALVCGAHSVLVRSKEGYGFSVVMYQDNLPPTLISKPVGMKLRDLAACIKSWNLIEASIGQAAINAYYNSPPVARKNGISVSSSQFTEDRIYDPFISYQNAIRDKKVAVIEHFPYLEPLFQPVCDLSILAKEPEEGEYPYSAAEYILPECDYVFVTCSAVVDKSLPRFLNLSEQAHVVIVGSSTPLAPVLSQFGVKNLSGFVIKDGEKALRICSGQEASRIYATGQKVNLIFENSTHKKGTRKQAKKPSMPM
jgi:uncharacterized protein (DUF4213/DUF364 family)